MEEWRCILGREWHSHRAMDAKAFLHSSQPVMGAGLMGRWSRIDGPFWAGGFIKAEKGKARPGRRPRTASLDREQAAYEANLPHWLPDHEGKYVLIKGDEVVGFYESRDEALAAG